MTNQRSSDEERLRQKLGIPGDAVQVLIFTESSHWDPNWLWTSQAYFERLVRPNLDQAIAALLEEPRRVYSVECLFFLRMYWDRCPEKRAAVRDLVNAGRLRLTSSGVTTPDTLLPRAEAILRDWLMGQEWLRANGMQQEPRLAYIVDSFGCTPNLPSLLRAAGFDRTAITRVDGMYFPGCDPEPPWRYPLAGSSAERLLKEERSLDFRWRDANGAQVLCHWNAFTYGQGDMLAHLGLSRVYLARLALSLRTGWHIARRIRRYARQLRPFSRTPYMLCPIGFDFVEPIPNLLALLDRYNRDHYPRTGIWAANAGLDDYLELVENYQDRLPRLELDPNPYWTGFYSARPSLKRRCHRLVEDLLHAEKLSLLPENRASQQAINRALSEPWWAAVTANHHDFITGTSPDSVVEGEQIPWLEEAAQKVGRITERLTSTIPIPKPGAPCARPPAWEQQGERVRIITAHYEIELAGGSVVSLRRPGSGHLLLGPLSNELICYRDSGGLWRMGLEFRGGIWKETARAGRQPTEPKVYEHEGGLQIVDQVHLDGQPFQRSLWVREDSPLIYGRVQGLAPQGHSVTVRFRTAIRADGLVMDTPGGVVARPPRRIYNPTFWPLHRFVHLQDRQTGQGLAILQPLPGAIAYDPEGTLQLVAMRNATRERVLGLLPLPANPASGHERQSYAFEYAFLFTPGGDWQANSLHRLAMDLGAAPWGRGRDQGLGALHTSLITTNRPEVSVRAIKPAARGRGIIARLYAPALPEGPVLVRAPGWRVARAFLCDARERDLEALPVRDGAVQVSMPWTATTIRLVPGQSP
jgi:hypothetical protein